MYITADGGTMTTMVHAEGPSCPACSATSYRAVRMLRAAGSDRRYVVAIRWACCQCGLRFTDALLDLFNAEARLAGAARLARPTAAVELDSEVA